MGVWESDNSVLAFDLADATDSGRQRIRGGRGRSVHASGEAMDVFDGES